MGSKRTFASALDWPGWSRSGKGETAAIEALAAYGSRYRSAIGRGLVKLPPDAEEMIKVVETTAGDASTEFGVPGKPAALELKAPAHAELERLLGLLAACWTAFDGAVATAPAELISGPRGGGRDRDKVAAHVIDAEGAYAGKLGVRLRAPAFADTDAVAAFREAMVAGVRAAAETWKQGERGWPARYAIRRIAWHALDHAWEIEDRSPR